MTQKEKEQQKKEAVLALWSTEAWTAKEIAHAVSRSVFWVVGILREVDIDTKT